MLARHYMAPFVRLQLLQQLEPDYVARSSLECSEWCSRHLRPGLSCQTTVEKLAPKESRPCIEALGRFYQHHGSPPPQYPGILKGTRFNQQHAPDALNQSTTWKNKPDLHPRFRTDFSVMHFDEDPYRLLFLALASETQDGLNYTQRESHFSFSISWVSLIYTRQGNLKYVLSDHSHRAQMLLKIIIL